MVTANNMKTVATGMMKVGQWVGGNYHSRYLIYGIGSQRIMSRTAK
jgi:hypothetical protein